MHPLKNQIALEPLVNKSRNIFLRSRKNWDALAADNPADAVLTGFPPDEKSRVRFYASGEKKIRSLLERLDTLGVAYGHDSALDFGCGIGRLTRALATRFDKTWGADVSPHMIEIAEQSDSSNTCNFVALEQPDLKIFESGSFDFVISLLVLQHIDPAIAPDYFDELLRVLKPGGVLVLQVPDSPSWSLKGMRLRIMRLLPRPAAILVRTITRKPEVMMMNCIRETAISDMAASHGVEIQAVDKTMISGWHDRTYFLTRTR